MEVLERNATVERVARYMHDARVPAESWDALPEQSKQTYREPVAEVLLAAMCAGLVLREVVPNGGGATMDPWPSPSPHRSSSP